MVGGNGNKTDASGGTWSGEYTGMSNSVRPVLLKSSSTKNAASSPIIAFSQVAAIDVPKIPTVVDTSLDTFVD